jgi:hypothetical protein
LRLLELSVVDDAFESSVDAHAMPADYELLHLAQVVRIGRTCKDELDREGVPFDVLFTPDVERDLVATLVELKPLLESAARLVLVRVGHDQVLRLPEARGPGWGRE